MAPLIGWPFKGIRPISHGVVDGIAWATAPGWRGNSINGYAQIPAEHPWADTTDTEQLPVEVHGGLSFGPREHRVFDFSELAELAVKVGSVPVPESLRNAEPFETTEVTLASIGGWVGFDTAHAGDRWEVSTLRAHGLDPETDSILSNLYRPDDPPLTLAYVEREAQHLAAQIAHAHGEARRVLSVDEAADQ